MTEARAGSGSASRISGFTVILVATVISGVASYVVTWLVPHRIGLVGYAAFAVFWSAIYLVVGALFGVQQEITRATRELPPGAPRQVSRARDFGLAAGAVVFVLIVATAVLWVGPVFPVGAWALVWPLAVGTSGFVMVAVLSGSLYGVSAWRAIAAMLITDSFLRLLLIGVVLLVTDDTVALAWAVALPFPLTIVLLWPFVRRVIVGRTQLDSGYRALTWNVARTIVAAASTGAMVSGFPLFIGLTSAGESATLVGLVILTVTLVRAPLIVVAMSIQSYLIVSFRDASAGTSRLLAMALGSAVGAGIVLGVLGWLIGPAVFAFLFPGKPVPDGVLIGLLVLSSGFVAALCISGAAVLARNRHVVYSVGWLVAALVTLSALLLPYDFVTRTVVSVLAGPIAGLIVHGIHLNRSRARGVSAPS